MRVIKKFDFVLFRADLGSQKVSRVMNYRVLQKKKRHPATLTAKKRCMPNSMLLHRFAWKGQFKKNSHFQWIGLRENFKRKAPYLMGKSMVSCRCSLKPIH